MGLLDEAREKANCYISPKDFLCFMSYKLGEPIQEIVSFLLYNNFDVTPAVKSVQLNLGDFSYAA